MLFRSGVGPLMTEVAAEVGDGYFVHPFHTAESLEVLSRPALERGLARAGKSAEDFVISAQVITATGQTEEEMDAAMFSARHQLAFYASTPAYLPVLAVHGLEALQPEAGALLKAGKWAEVAGLVSDDILHQFALVGTPAEVAAGLRQRFDGRVDRVSPVIYSPQTELLAELIGEIRK